MKYEVRYINASGEGRTLSVEAENYNEAARQAKASRKDDEVIAEIYWNPASFFDDIMRDTFLTPLGALFHK